MDMERPLKFDGEYFGIQTDSDFNECFKEGFVEDVEESYVKLQQSLELNTGLDSSSHIVDRIRLNVNLALTPMSQLIQIAKSDYEWNLKNEEQLRRTLWKSKLIEKRERARNRKICREETKKNMNKVIDVISLDRGEDIKKQKNRLSAQISRDRKKQYYLKLEQENQELKRSLNQLNRANAELQRRQPKEVEDPKKKGEGLFKSLLILLGIIFLMNLIRGSSEPRNQRQSEKLSLSKIELSKQEKNFVCSQLRAFGVQLNINQKQKQRKDYYIDRSLGNKIIQIKSSLF